MRRLWLGWPAWTSSCGLAATATAKSSNNGWRSCVVPCEGVCPIHRLSCAGRPSVPHASGLRRVSGPRATACKRQAISCAGYDPSSRRSVPSCWRCWHGWSLLGSAKPARIDWRVCRPSWRKAELVGRASVMSSLRTAGVEAANAN